MPRPPKSKPVDMASPLPESDWRPPRPEWKRRTFAIELDHTDWLAIRLEHAKKYLVEFSISHWHTKGESSIEIARVDSCHDHVHLHRFRADGTESRHVEFSKPLAVSDIKAGYNWGLALLRTKWDDHVAHYWKSGG